MDFLKTFLKLELYNRCFQLKIEEKKAQEKRDSHNGKRTKVASQLGRKKQQRATEDWRQGCTLYTVFSANHSGTSSEGSVFN